MISIEKVQNGFILRVEENEEDYTMVLQKEYDSMNVALGQVFQKLIEMWQEDDEPLKIKLDVQP